ncbi:MAG: FecR domain-containing protein [Balneolaceae bacterium]|nr:FecR domain-containing protein [Balneolaceae bacterium]
MKEKDFTIQELKEDPSFRRMVRGIASAEEVESWNRWIESSDENRLKAKKALSKMVRFEFRSPDMPNIECEWKQLQEATTGSGKVRKPLPPIRRDKDRSLRWIFRAVAIILLVSFVGIGTYQFSEEDSSVLQLELLTEERTIETEQGEQKTLQFSNGSKVILNSHSSLTYRLGGSKNSTIEITLDGEAWFDADPNRESDQPAFAVATPDGIIRDIGTKFLVTVENGHSRVVLQEGLVEVEPVNNNQGNLSGQNEGRFRVRKGEMVEFRRSDIITRKEINPTFYSSWATGVLELDQSGVQEFAEYVEQRFDVDVQIRDLSLKDIQLNGTVYFRSLDELMRSVSEVIGIPVYRSADRDMVYIGNLK